MNRRRLISSTIGAWTIAIGLFCFPGCSSDDAHRAATPAPGSILTPDLGDVRNSGPSDSRRRKGDNSPERVVRKVVNGGLGGEITNGRYKVVFSPGAFTGLKTITLTNEGMVDGRCSVQPEGLYFNAPVLLSIDLTGMDQDSPYASIEWWDPHAYEWIDLGASYDPATHVVSLNLYHFSSYRPRAGW